MQDHLTVKETEFFLLPAVVRVASLVVLLICTSEKLSAIINVKMKFHF